MESSSGVGKLDLSNQISVAVARKTLDLQKQQGDAVLKLLEAASEVQSEEAQSSDGGLDVYG